MIGNASLSKKSKLQLAHGTIEQGSGDCTVLIDASSRFQCLFRCKCSNCSLKLITKQEECWCCIDIDKCGKKMYDLEKEGECITEHPGYAACCLNMWVLSTAATSLKV